LLCVADEGVGERVRRLREGCGLSQEALAAGRFSKEYVSQIERGKTRPSEKALGWLAERLGVDLPYLKTGVGEAERGRIEAVLAEAERLSQQSRYAEALALFAEAAGFEAAGRSRELGLRLLFGESWALLQTGGLERSRELLAEAEGLVETELDRAELLLRLGVLRYRASEMPEAARLLSEALVCAEAADTPSDVLRVEILGWRSRCYRRSRDWLAAREDAERAMELAEGANDKRGLANALSQAANVAYREGNVPGARRYADQARALYFVLDDAANVSRLTNDLAGFNLLLGHLAEAISLFEEALQMALTEGHQGNAALALGSLAEAHLRDGQPAQAEAESRRAIELCAGRIELLQVLGEAQLTLGRALIAQDRSTEAEEVLQAADKSFQQLSSVSHQAAAWVAQGDLAEHRDDPGEAARLYRRAAEALRQPPS
jgi:tetratricopeptide (TPR) repeat protein